MAQSRKNSKSLVGMNEIIKKTSKESTPDVIAPQISAPKYGTVIPDRVFVGGIASNTTSIELTEFFSKYGKVVEAKIISDRAGVSKGYGFITFASDEEVKQLLDDVRTRDIMLRERKLNIAPAIKKQSFTQRLESNSSGAGSVASGGLFPAAPGMAYAAYHNGMAYFSAPPPAQPQPAPQPPPTPQHHIDPNLFAGYGVPAPPAQYPPMLYNHQPVYFQQPAYSPYSLAYETGGDMSNAGLVDGTSPGGGAPAAGPQLMVSGYFLPDGVTGAPLFAAPAPPHEYAAQYQYQTQYPPAAAPQPMHDPNLITYSPRRYYDPLFLSEQRNSGLHLANRPVAEVDEKEDRKLPAPPPMAVMPVPMVPTTVIPQQIPAAKPISNNNNPEQTNRNLNPPPTIPTASSNPISSSPQVQPYPVYPTHRGTAQAAPASYHQMQVNNNSFASSNYSRRQKGTNAYYQAGQKKSNKRYVPSGGGGSVSSFGSGTGGGIGHNNGGGNGGNSPLSTPRSSDQTPSSTPSTPASNPASQDSLIKPMQALAAI